MCACLALSSRLVTLKPSYRVSRTPLRRFCSETRTDSLYKAWYSRNMTSPWPENTQPLSTPPPEAKPWKGEAILENGLKCTYYMADMDSVKAKKDAIVGGGPDTVIIISDFDRTISTHFHTMKDGAKVMGQTAYSLLSDSKIMSEAYRTKTKQLHDHFFPLEFDPTISYDQKYKLMDEWWAKSSGALVDQSPTLETLYAAVSHAKLDLRPGFATVVQVAHQHEIPIIVFSAGITQVIEEILRKLGPTDLLLPNVHVVANDLIVDPSTNVVTSFVEPMMHSLNKKDTSVKLVRGENPGQAWFNQLKHRKNVILMGDSVGDANMSDGYDGDKDVTILKIGFLNANEEALLETYRKAFDIVVLHDGPMVPVATFLNEIIDAHPKKNDHVVVPETP